MLSIIPELYGLILFVFLVRVRYTAYDAYEIDRNAFRPYLYAEFSVDPRLNSFRKSQPDFSDIGCRTSRTG